MIEALDQQPTGRTKAELLATISASRLGTWLSCRLKFYFRYLSGLRKPPSPAMRVGTVVHAVLQQWSLARWRRAPLQGGMIRSVFDQAWLNAGLEETVQWDGEEDSIKAGAFALIETYLRDTPIPEGERPEAVEVSVEKDLGAYGLPTLVGVIDLVRQGGRIVDFKTAGKTPSIEDVIHLNEIQLSCYSVLYREAAGKVEMGRELHHLVKTKTPKLIITQLEPMNETQQVRLFRMMDAYVEGLAREDFVPSPGLHCNGCEFFNECRRWA